MSDSGQKKDFLTSEKPGKVACWRYFFKCTSELEKFFGIVDQLRVFGIMFRSGSENLDLTNLNIAPFSLALCLGLIENISNLLLHRFLLIARHYIYSCKLRNTFPLVQVYTQLVIRSMEIEKQIVFDNNNLASFRKKWATFKQCPSEIIWSIPLIKVQVTNGQMGDGGP